MTIAVGSIWVGTQVHHKWKVRVRKVMLQHVLVEVTVEPALRPNGLRVSPHFYNTTDDIDHFVEIVATLSRAER